MALGTHSCYGHGVSLPRLSSTGGAIPTPHPHTSASGRVAQVLLRTWAAATNLLICGRRFLLLTPPESEQTNYQGYVPIADALDELLTGLGAHAHHGHGLNDAPLPLAHYAAIFDFTGLIEKHPETTVVHAHSTTDIHVIGPDNTELQDPHSSCPASAQARIAWARAHMPVTTAAVQRLAERGTLMDQRIGLSLVLEPKTAVLALLLHEAGATVSVFGHADEIRDDVAHYLRHQGIPVYGYAQMSAQEEKHAAVDFLSQQLTVLLDDGSHLIRMAHEDAYAPVALRHMIGAAEETTSGLRPLRIMERDSALKIPVVASNDARSKTLFDNAYGTGQSCLFTIMDLLDANHEGLHMGGLHVLVIGYGDVGRGFARLIRAFGAKVTICDTDSVRLLQAYMDGYEVCISPDAVAENMQWIVSATGVRHTINSSVLACAPDGCVLSVIGGVAQEIALEEAIAAGASWEPTGDRAVDILRFADGRGLKVMDKGGCINCTAGEGNPIEIMDMSFGVQTAAVEYLLTGMNARESRLHALPATLDHGISQMALKFFAPSASVLSDFSLKHDAERRDTLRT
nr:adenosylhomocysteinase [Schaalia sp. lx-100]